MKKFERLNYQVLSDAFVRNGWKKHHLFMIGDSWAAYHHAAGHDSLF